MALDRRLYCKKFEDRQSVTRARALGDARGLEQKDRVLGGGRVIGIAEHGGLPVVLVAVECGQPAHHAAGVARVFRLRAPSARLIPPLAAGRLHQLVGKHRVRKASCRRVRMQKGGRRGGVIAECAATASAADFVHDPLAGRVAVADDALHLVDCGGEVRRAFVFRNERRGRKRRPDRAQRGRDASTGGPRRSNRFGERFDGHAEAFVFGKRDGFDEERQPRRTIVAVGGDARAVKGARERGSDGVAQIVAPGRRVLSQQERDRFRRGRASAFVEGAHGAECGVCEPIEQRARGVRHRAAIIMTGLARTITLIPGDGIGPEVTAAVVRIIDAADVAIDWERHDAGVLAVERTGTPLPLELVDSIRRNKVALKGPVTTPVGEGFTSVNVGLRKSLDLYANLRPVWNLPGVPARFSGVDLIIVRENTEDLYAGLEHEVVPGVVESLKIITERASTRIAIFAFEYARRNGRTRVTSIHKANIMKQSDGLFLESCRRVARNYTDITYDERIVDAACMHLVMNPGQFDVLVMPNLYGDIVSDLCAGLVGGLGVVGAANLGAGIGVFEAVHGSAPDIAGKQIANPTALLLSAVLMLRHIDENRAADRIMSALSTVLQGRRTLTRDLGGTASTMQFADAVAAALA